ncbi:MAG: excinuclease ABC subunit A [Candidatus Mycalebacterium zealandia]|nr:MAG: excinuclease ABC subunit A [Candidatus Mycalebacterium zealandia]
MAKTSKPPLVVKGARENNLKNINVEIPTGSFTVVTGLSGSGKSSLAVDTIHSESMRKYIQCLSTYTRQFLDRAARPDVDAIENLPPSISIENRNRIQNNRSTLGTTTEIYDYLRLLFSSVGKVFCPDCGEEANKHSPESIAKTLLLSGKDENALIFFAPSKDETAQRLLKRGFLRLFTEKEDVFKIDKNTELPPEYGVVVDRIKITKKSRARMIESLETAFRESETICVRTGNGKPLSFTQDLSCAKCGQVFSKPYPSMFSFNSPNGACGNCNGFGNTLEIDRSLVIPDDSKSLRGGAVEPFARLSFGFARRKLVELAEKNEVDPDTPFSKLKQKEKDLVFQGDGSVGVARGGVEGFFKKIAQKIYKVQNRVFLSRYRSARVCDECGGKRIRPFAAAVKIGGHGISELCEMPVGELVEFFSEKSLSKILSKNEIKLAADALKEVQDRCRFLDDVGLEYLTLSRLTRTLSGGESQRAALACQIGSGLTETLYILDEPSVGLHPRDTRNMVSIIKRIKEKGNTLIVVEHDPDIIKESDYIVELGRETGENGGKIVYQGAAGKLVSCARDSYTGLYLSGEKSISAPRRNKKKGAGKITVIGAAENNLKNMDVSIPLETLVCVTGVSGSGKSSLIKDVLHNNLANALYGENFTAGKCEKIIGSETVRDVVMLDQLPIGKNSRSNPVTYIKAYDSIRKLMASSAGAKENGLTQSDFSFNIAGGRCDACEGEGIQKIEMLFLADVSVVCPECEGKRFKTAVLETKFRDKNIDDVLNMTVSEAAGFFSDSSPVVKKLNGLLDVGLGYLRLGQPATTLSGGEAQRIKIVRELSRKDGKNILYILDEPSIGLHMEDVRKLLSVLEELISAGNSVVVIEHNPEIIKTAEHIIDLGPGGGENGGKIVAEGTPEQVAENKKSETGKFLKLLLEKPQ